MAYYGLSVLLLFLLCQIKEDEMIRINRACGICKCEGKGPPRKRGNRWEYNMKITLLGFKPVSTMCRSDALPLC